MGTDTTEARLRFAAEQLSDQTMAAVLNAAADAWRGGDCGPLVRALVKFVDELLAEATELVRTRAAKTGCDCPLVGDRRFGEREPRMLPAHTPDCPRRAA